MKKVAIVTDEGEFVSQHFGRARYYKVFSADDSGQIIDRELRERHTPHAAGNGHTQHEHDSHTAEGHGFGGEAHAKHQAMIETILDCQCLVAGGMGRGALVQFQEAGIEVILTDELSCEVAATAWLEGRLVDRSDELAH